MPWHLTRHSGKPVEDIARENQVLNNVRAQAPHYGVSPEEAARFFAAQIEANKWVQYHQLHTWRLTNQVLQQPLPDLAVLRKQLDELQGKLLSDFSTTTSIRHLKTCASLTTQAVKQYAQTLKLNDLHRQALIRSFGNFCDTSLP